MVGRQGVLFANVLATLLQQPATQIARWAPPQPCNGDSTETHARRGFMIPVPNLEGMSILRARVALTRLGLRIDVRSVQLDGPADVVIGQAPQPGSFAGSADAVIVCSRRPPVFPNVVGLGLDEARKRLSDAGYSGVKITSFVEPGARVGIVIRQQPTAGAAAPRGSADTIVVGAAPAISTTSPPGGPPSKAPQSQPPQPQPKTAVLTPTRTVAPSPDVPVEFDEPMDLAWLGIAVVAAGVVLATAAATIKAKDRRRLAALHVVPRQHAGNPHVVVARRTRSEARDD
jgi:PASTA domain